MKSFICSLLTLAVLTAVVITNCIYVKGCAEELMSLADGLQYDSPSSDIARIKDRWDSCKKLISLSVDHKETDEIDDTLSKLETHAQLGALSAFASELTALKCQLQRLAESESFSPDRIF